MAVCGSFLVVSIRLWSYVGGFWSFVVVCGHLLVVCGNLLLFAVGLWWFVVVCGGLWSLPVLVTSA